MEEVPSWAIDLIKDIGETKGMTKQILDQTQKTNGRVLILEGKVDCLERDRDVQNGAKTVKNSTWSKIWDIGKIVIAALIGAIAGRVKVQ